MSACPHFFGYCLNRACPMAKRLIKLFIIDARCVIASSMGDRYFMGGWCEGCAPNGETPHGANEEVELALVQIREAAKFAGLTHTHPGHDDTLPLASSSSSSSSSSGPSPSPPAAEQEAKLTDQRPKRKGTETSCDRCAALRQRRETKEEEEIRDSESRMSIDAFDGGIISDWFYEKSPLLAAANASLRRLNYAVEALFKVTLTADGRGDWAWRQNSLGFELALMD